MKICLFNAHDIGGAGKAVSRLNNALNEIGQDSTLFVKWKTTDDPKVIPLQSSEIVNKVFDQCTWNNFSSNIYEGNTLCSVMYPSVGFEYLNLLQDFDIVNLHWIPSLVSLEAVVKIRQMGKPIVWTLHDQNPMTGACHYTHGCEKYKADCSECPQLKDNKYDVTKTILQAKIKYLPSDIVVVTPSRWLADCAKESMVFRNHHIEVIPNSLETDIYKPINNNEAKKRLGINSKAKVILFGAQDLKEKRKGVVELADAVKWLRVNDNINKLIEKDELYILTFGQPSPLLDRIGIPYRTLGYVKEDEMLAAVYSAADVLALPSLEDNLPNIMLESMACGTPVVAFEIGGMVDVIKNGSNGYLVPLKDAKKFAERIIDVINGKPMGEYCRQLAVQNYRLEVQANKYKELFQKILKNHKPISISSYVPIMFPEITNFMAPYIFETTIEVQNEWNNLEAENNQTLQAKTELLQERNALIQERDILRNKCDDLSTELHSLYRSKSWKSTKPLRIGWKIMKKTVKFILPYAVVRYIQKKK